MTKLVLQILILLYAFIHSTNGFHINTCSSTFREMGCFSVSAPTKYYGSASSLFSMTPDDDNQFTVKQRLREEVESPFRKVRLYFFGFSTVTALLALYFSSISALKASLGGFTDTMPIDEALTSCGINISAALICGALTYRDIKAGRANLERIAKGGALAKLKVLSSVSQNRLTLSDYRRNSRVLIAAGGMGYISELARSLNSDQLADNNTIVCKLAEVDVVVVPVLLQTEDRVGDTMSCWQGTIPVDEMDRNFDISRSDDVLAFPVGNYDWEQFLKSEIETAKGQGFNVVDKGITLMVKKNGRILRRATGQPQWASFLGTMEVLDGSKFGMPGDTEKYG